MTIKLKKEVSFKIPRQPNFLRYENNEKNYIDVADLSKDEIEQVAQQLAMAFIEHAHQRIRDRNHLNKKA